MGLDDRIPLSRAGLDTVQPVSKSVADNASQPPIGCQYVDESSTYTTCTVNTSTTLDFLATAGNVLYDPYNLIDLTANTVKIPFPGVWDISIEANIEAFAAAGDHFYVAFNQGNFTVSGLNQMVDDAVAQGTEFKRLSINKPFYANKALLGTSSLFTVRGLATGNTNDAKIITFSMWLRSAVVPGKY